MISATSVFAWVGFLELNHLSLFRAVFLLKLCVLISSGVSISLKLLHVKCVVRLESITREELLIATSPLMVDRVQKFIEI